MSIDLGWGDFLIYMSIYPAPSICHLVAKAGTSTTCSRSGKRDSALGDQETKGISQDLGLKQAESLDMVFIRQNHPTPALSEHFSFSIVYSCAVLLTATADGACLGVGHCYMLLGLLPWCLARQGFFSPSDISARC